MTSVAEALAGVSRLGLDTSPIIYFVESHPKYDSRTTRVFEIIEGGSVVGVTSVVTLIEVLTQPLSRGHTQLYLQYRELLLNANRLEMVSIDPAVAEQAAVLRAEYGLRTPDALQVAAAVESGCEAFLTNDSALKRVKRLRVLVLDELEA